MEYTEEEKKAIEDLDKVKNIFVHLKNKGWIKDIKREINTDKAINSIDIVLNLLEKQQREITTLENTKHNCPLINTSGVTCEMKERGIVIGMDFSVLGNKEVSDALHMLLHCALKDKEYETQREQFNIVYSYIEQLEKESADKEKCYNECFCEYKHYKQYESIPKEAIREKIKELESYIYKGENAPQDFLQYRVKAKIQILSELLGE